MFAPTPHNRATRRKVTPTAKRPSQGVTKPRDGAWIPSVDPIAFECRALRRMAQKARRAARKRGGAVIDWTPLSAW